MHHIGMTVTAGEDKPADPGVVAHASREVRHSIVLSNMTHTDIEQAVADLDSFQIYIEEHEDEAMGAVLRKLGSTLRNIRTSWRDE
jgi:hypothetical protein